MGDQKLERWIDPVGRSRATWALARQQHGVVTRAQLLDLGFSSKAIEHRIHIGRLHPVQRGVYAVGRRELSREGQWTVAVLTCGHGAILSHRSAAALWRIGSERNAAERNGCVDISLRRHATLRRPGIRVRIRAALPASSVTCRHGIPVTTPLQTLIDVATEVDRYELERCVSQADVHDLIDPETLRVALDSRAGEPGVPFLRQTLDRHTFRLSDSDLEILFRAISAKAGLPPILTKQIVNGHEVDFYFPSLGLVIETDGWRYHRTPAQQTRDARRFQHHTAAGLTPLRFSHWQVKYEPTYVIGILARTRRRIQARGGSNGNRT